MSDVRLVATNPEDSSLVPVACNSRGEMMIVEPTIEKISNDVEIEGDLTVTGTINGDTGGGVLPEPLGPDGSILAIENGAPAWIGKSDLCAPPPPVGDQVIFSGGTDAGVDYPAVAINAYGDEEGGIADFNTWMKSQAGWADQPNVYDNTGGIGKSVGNGVRVGYKCQVKEAAGKVLTMGFRWNYTKTAGVGSASQLSLSLGETNYAAYIVSTIPGVDDNNLDTGKMMGQFSILLKRDNVEFIFRVSGDGGYLDGGGPLVMQWFHIQEQNEFLMQDLISREERKRKASARLSKAVTTTDIDLLR